MGLKQIQRVFGIKGVSIGERYLLTILAYHCNKDSSVCWPSLRTLADETQMHYNSVCSLFNKLIDRGFVKKFFDENMGVIKYHLYFDVIEIGIGFNQGLRGNKSSVSKQLSKDCIEVNQGLALYKVEEKRRELEKKLRGEEVKQISKSTGESLVGKRNIYMGKSIEGIAGMKSERYEIGRIKGKLKPVHLEGLWKRVHADTYIGDFVSPNENVRQGLFTQFIKFVREDQAEMVLYHLIKEWAAFAVYAKDYGAKGSPAKPAMKFVLAYLEPAVSFAINCNELSQEVVSKKSVDPIETKSYPTEEELRLESQAALKKILEEK